jgi:hypothetical protein
MTLVYKSVVETLIKLALPEWKLNRNTRAIIIPYMEAIYI